MSLSWGSFMAKGVYDSDHRLALLVVLLFVAVIILKAYQSISKHIKALLMGVAIMPLRKQAKTIL
jgi:hypothetical protein